MAGETLPSEMLVQLGNRAQESSVLRVDWYGTIYHLRELSALILDESEWSLSEWPLSDSKKTLTVF